VTFEDPEGELDELYAGFTLLRSGTDASPVTGSQAIPLGAQCIAVHGFGETGGDLLLLNPGEWNESGKTQTTYGAPLILARGSYTETLPTFIVGHVDNVGNVFDDMTGTENIALMLSPASTDTRLVFIPEPATVGPLGLGSVGLALLRRRR
jgi:hypothetical protein